MLCPVSFVNLPGWACDDHSAAMQAFLRTRDAFEQKPLPVEPPSYHGISQSLEQTFEEAGRLLQPVSAATAREFFEMNYSPFRVTVGAPGLLTGYFEPILAGSRRRSANYGVPVYRRPADLVNVGDDTLRGHLGDELTAGRQTADGLRPYLTRAEIEDGALAGEGLELLFLEDPVACFFMHVQGSAMIRLDDGETIRIGYAGKNGYRYTSIGKLLIERGEIAREDMSLEALWTWLGTDLVRANALMQKNESFIFFRELDVQEASEGPIGALGVPLTEERSLAVDAGVHMLGLPIFVVADNFERDGTAFQRLMIAQDVGSAIKGPQRGDIFWGTGAEAGRRAGETAHQGQFFVLLPNSFDWRSNDQA